MSPELQSEDQNPVPLIKPHHRKGSLQPATGILFFYTTIYFLGAQKFLLFTDFSLNSWTEAYVKVKKKKSM